MANPLFSVILPTYRSQSADLLRSLESVLDQSLGDLEVIVVDDGSEIPFSGLKNRVDDPRVRWVRLAKNGGVANARNQGVAKSRGAFLAFLDAGDWWDREKLRLQRELLEKGGEDLVLVYASAVKHYESGKTQSITAGARGDVYRDLLVGQPITGSCSSAVVPRRLFEKVGGFHTREEIPEDRDLWLRLVRHGSVELVAEPLVHLMVKAESRSMNIPEKEASYRRFVELHERELIREGLMGEAMARYHGTIAWRFFQARQLFPGLVHQLRAMRYRPSFSSFRALLSGALLCANPGVYWWVRRRFGRSTFEDEEPRHQETGVVDERS